jgi:hypothetical protein
MRSVDHLIEAASQASQEFTGRRLSRTGQSRGISVEGRTGKKAAKLQNSEDGPRNHGSRPKVRQTHLQRRLTAETRFERPAQETALWFGSRPASPVTKAVIVISPS